MSDDRDQELEILQHDNATLRARLAEVEQIMAEADVVDMNDLRMRLKGCDVYADIAKAKEVEAIRETDRAMAAEARVELLEKFVKKFVRAFEMDFVMEGQIVDDPNSGWSLLTEMYNDARAALQSGEREEKGK